MHRTLTYISSLILNPKGKHYSQLKGHLEATFEDCYYNEDAIFMERNSRDFQTRTKVIDKNTEAVCDFLYPLSAAAGQTGSVIKDVFYPKFTTTKNYEQCRIKGDSTREDGGYGGLFSVVFTSQVAAAAFFDSLPCFKGPSLGTNFTLACPFTILAHYGELEWAAQQGVEANLVRVSIGLEDTSVLLAFFGEAFRAAETAVAVAGA